MATEAKDEEMRGGGIEEAKETDQLVLKGSMDKDQAALIAELRAELEATRRSVTLLETAVKGYGMDPQAILLRGTPSASMYAGNGATFSYAEKRYSKELVRGMTPSTVKLLDGDVDLKDVPLEKFAEIMGKSRGITVKVKALNYTVTRKAMEVEETVGGRVKKLASLFCCGPCLTKPTTRTILKDINTIFEPGEITLLTGPAGCGKSLLLKAIAGRLSLNKTHRVTGTITYNGDEPKGNFSLPKVATYIDQRDCHIAELTVMQTFEFAYKSMGLGTLAFTMPRNLTPEQQKLVDLVDSRNGTVQFVLKSLGLLNARNTVIGNEVLRGVSGGERRRVTAGEMMCGPSKVMMFDSISTGLDSSTTFDIITTLKALAKTFNRTIVIALLQPPPEVYELFQNVCVMAEGSIVYQGKREGLLPYFGKLGYRCPPRKDVADYIVELPTDAGSAYFEPETARDHLTPEEFIKAWKDSSEYANMMEEVNHAQEEKAKWEECQVRKLAGTWTYHTKLCFKQQFLLMIGDKAYLKSRLATVLIMGVIIGTVFINIPFEDYTTKLGVLYFSLMYLSMSTATQVLTGFAKRQVTYKHLASGFYGVSNDSVANIVTSLPMLVVEVTLFSPLVYFLSGLDRDPARFFTFLIVQFCVYLNFGQLMRFLAAFCPDRSQAQGLAMVIILMTILYSGYILPPDVIPIYWKWVYKCNPLSYGFNAVVINEFTAPKYNVCLNGNTSSDCLTYGQSILDSFGFGSSESEIWRAVGIIVAEWIAMSFVTALTFKYLVWDVTDNAPIAASDAEDQTSTSGACTVFSALGAGATGGGGGLPTVKWHDMLKGTSTSTNARVVDVEAGLGGGSTASKQGREEITEAAISRRQTTESESLPFKPVTLAFRDIWYSVKHPAGEGELDLLKGISGYAKPGTMTALMGSSGAGKTTLMDVLAGRKTGGTIKGDILLNGYPKVQETYTRIAGYCEQMDIHSAVVTVREALTFSAAMRLDNKLISAEQRQAHVNSVLDLLELQPIEEDVIGSMEGGGLSVEQRKRVTIGVELCANPSLIFADEPTSGLDSRSAQVVMKCINAVAESGRAIVCTIHQPSSYIFEMFDHLLLLKKGGETVYFGELGTNSVSLIKFLEGIPGTNPYKEGLNPATWMLECIGAGTSGTVDPQLYADYYKVSELCARNAEDTNKHCEVKPGVEELVFEQKYAAPMGAQYKACIERAKIQYWRSPNYNFSKIMLNAIIATIMGSNLYDQPYDTEAAMFSRLAMLYSSAAFVGNLYFSMPIPFVYAERVVFYREQASNMYFPSAFAMGFGLAEIPYTLLSAFAFTAIFYFFSEYSSEPGKFFLYWLPFTIYVMFQAYLGAYLVNVCPSMPVAQNIGTIINTIFNIFAGFMITPGNISNFWKIFFFLDPMHYYLAASATSQYHNNNNLITLGTGGTVTAEEFVRNTFDGEYVFGSYWYYIIGLTVFVVTVRALNLYAVLYVRHINR